MNVQTSAEERARGKNSKYFIERRGQGSKLTLANSQNVSDFDELRVRKISTSKCLRVRIIHVSQTFGKNMLVEKILPAKLCEWTEKSTSSPGG